MGSSAPRLCANKIYGASSQRINKRCNCPIGVLECQAQIYLMSHYTHPSWSFQTARPPLRDERAPGWESVCVVQGRGRRLPSTGRGAVPCPSTGCSCPAPEMPALPQENKGT